MEAQMDVFMHSGQCKSMLKLLEEQTAEVRKKYNLKKAEMEILYYLSRCGDRNTSTDIHHQLVMNRGQISQAADKLCQRTLLVAIPDTVDRRYIHYQLTEEAQLIAEEVGQCWAALDGAIFEGISAEELEVFRSVSRRIQQNMEHAK